MILVRVFFAVVSIPQHPDSPFLWSQAPPGAGASMAQWSSASIAALQPWRIKTYYYLGPVISESDPIEIHLSNTFWGY